MNCSFSVCTSVYKNDSPQFVKEALDSMLIAQSIKPMEIVLVQDGPIPYSLSDLLSSYEEHYKNQFRVIRLEQNKGLGNALRVGVENAKYDIIARMDSDDLCLPDRFEKQLSFLECHPEVDIVGGQMTEFVNSPDNIISKRVVPLTNDKIYKFMKSRCGMNHVTVMFKKQAVVSVGNYQDWFWNEDYYLWIRMMESGCVFANLPDVLVNVRSGSDQFSRRGGWRYFLSEKGIKRLQLKSGMINVFEYFLYVSERFLLQVIIPSSLRGFLYRLLARQNV